jgi:hypothetical protein
MTPKGAHQGRRANAPPRFESPACVSSPSSVPSFRPPPTPALHAARPQSLAPPSRAMPCKSLRRWKNAQRLQRGAPGHRRSGVLPLARLPLPQNKRVASELLSGQALLFGPRSHSCLLWYCHGVWPVMGSFGRAPRRGRLRAARNRRRKTAMFKEALEAGVNGVRATRVS